MSTGDALTGNRGLVDEHGAQFRWLIELARTLEPIVTAVVHPVDANSLGGAIAALIEDHNRRMAL